MCNSSFFEKPPTHDTSYPPSPLKSRAFPDLAANGYVSFRNFRLFLLFSKEASVYYHSANYVIGELRSKRNHPKFFEINVTYLGIDGEFELVFGTSCSSPVVGSFITMVNDARLAAGKGPVGFINPAVRFFPQKKDRSEDPLSCRFTLINSRTRSMILRWGQIKAAVSDYYTKPAHHALNSSPLRRHSRVHRVSSIDNSSWVVCIKTLLCSYLQYGRLGSCYRCV